MGDPTFKSLQTLDISKNKLQNIKISNYPNNVSSPNFQIIVDSNPWSCLFLVSKDCLEMFKMFKYENDFSYVNVKGLNCSLDPSMPLELDYGVESSTTKMTMQIESTTQKSIETLPTKFIEEKGNETKYSEQSQLVIVIIFMLCVLVFFICIYFTNTCIHLFRKKRTPKPCVGDTLN